MIPALNELDVVLLAIVLVSVLVGLIRGLLRELLSFVFLALGLFLAFLFYPQTTQLLRKLIPSQTVAMVVAFFAILGLVLAAGAVIGWLIRQALTRGPLRALDRVFGGFFGLLRGCLLGAVLVLGLLAYSRPSASTPAPKPVRRLIQDSVLAPRLLEGLRWLASLSSESRSRSPLLQP